MSYSPEDDEPLIPRRPGTRFSQSLCSCDMCDANPAEETTITIEEQE